MLRIAENAIHGLVAADSRVNGGANGRADSLYASLVACASRLLACGVARRPFGNGFCGSAPNSARSAGRSVDLIFSPAPCGCRAFFCLGERRRVLDSYASLKIRTRFADRIGSSTRSPRRRSIRLRRMRQPQRTSTGKLFKNPCSQAELNKIVPFGFSLQRQKMVFFLPSK